MSPPDAPTPRAGRRRKAPPGDLNGLYGSAEFLIRRAHQLASAAFTEACRHLDLTPSQYAALFTLRQMDGTSHNELGRLVSLDRSTMSVVLRSLRERGLVDAVDDPTDRRKTRLHLTDAGRLTLAQAERRGAAAGDALLEPLGDRKAQLLLSLLAELSRKAGGETQP